MNESNILENEIILRPDGNFYKRETRESVIIDANSALFQTANQNSMTVSMVPQVLTIQDDGKPRTCFVYYGHRIKKNPEYLFAFVHLLHGFPFPSTDLKESHKNILPEGSEPVYTLAPRLNNGTHPEGSNYTPITPSETIYYDPPEYKMMLMLRFAVNHLGTSDAVIVPTNEHDHIFCHLFGINKETKDVHTFNIPNVYEDGRICTGDSFKNRNLIGTQPQSIASLPTIVGKAVESLHTARCNRDLSYPDLDEKFMYWIKNEESVGGYSTMFQQRKILHHYYPEPASQKREQKRFFIPITNEQIVDYSLCVKCTT